MNALNGERAHDLNVYNANTSNYWNGTNHLAGQYNADRSADMGVYKMDTDNENFDREMSMNRRDIHEFTDTPDLSDEFYAGKGNMLSGVGRKLAWLPAHLKVKDNEAIFIPALQRRINIILAFLSKMYIPFEKELKTIDITPIITPFDIDDDTEMIRTLMEANGGKPLLSQREAMQRFGITDPEAQLKQIKDEENSSLNEASI